MAKSSKQTTSAESGATRYAPENPAEDAAVEDFFYGDGDVEEEDALSPAVSTEETARYIAEMVASLAMMAREARLDLLNYLLDMAHVEAELQARRGEGPDEGA
jgi:hypothetical protein